MRYCLMGVRWTRIDPFLVSLRLSYRNMTTGKTIAKVRYANYQRASEIYGAAVRRMNDPVQSAKVAL